MPVLTVGCRALTVRDGKFGTTVQATKAGGALRLCPDGKAVAHLNRRHGAALGTQAAADAAIGIDGKLARLLHARQPNCVIRARCKQRHAMAHHVARAACPHRLDHGINLRLGSSIDTLNLLRVRQVETGVQVSGILTLIAASNSSPRSCSRSRANLADWPVVEPYVET